MSAFIGAFLCIFSFSCLLNAKPVDEFLTDSKSRLKVVSQTHPTNRFIIELNDRDKSDSKVFLKAISEVYPLKHLKSFESQSLSSFQVIETSQKIIQKLLAGKLIRSATPDFNFQILDKSDKYLEKPGLYRPRYTSDLYQSLQWGMHAARFPGTWSQLSENRALVFVADTWVDKNHPDLNASKISDVVSFLQPEMRNDNPKHYHGTHVTGIISAKSDNAYGIAGNLPDAKIIPLEVCYSQGCPLSAISEAIIYAADSFPEDLSPRVLNLSLGAPAHAAILSRAVSYAISKNVSIVVAAGNSFSDAINFYPAAYPGVISVGALARGFEKIGYQGYLPSMQLAFFSNYGEKSVSILAPGHEILSSVPSQYTQLPQQVLEQMYLSLHNNEAFSFLSGTSMAAPMVAAAIAAFRTEYPHFSNLEIKRILETKQPELRVNNYHQYANGTYKVLDLYRLIAEGRNTPQPVVAGQNNIRETVSINLNASYADRYGAGTHLEGTLSACDSPNQKVRIRWFSFTGYFVYSPNAVGYSIRNCGESFSVELPVSLPEEIGYFTQTPFVVALVEDLDTEGEVLSLNTVYFREGEDFLDLRTIIR